MNSPEHKGLMAMLFIMADIMSVDEIIGKLTDEIAEYKEAKLLGKPTGDIEKHMALTCMMYMHKQTNASAVENLKEMEKMSNLRNIIKPSEG